MPIGWWYRLDGRTPIACSTLDEWIAATIARDDEWDRDGVDPWRVAWTPIADGIEVSTVFLGLNHRYRPDGPPLLFETMVFGVDDDADVMWRWSTWDQALAGHDQVVAAVRAEVPD